MPKWGYSILTETLDPEKTAKASGREIRVSHKHAREICKTVKGMTLTNAKQYLRDVIAKKKAVPFTRYNKKAGHRHGLVKAAAGRYESVSVSCFLVIPSEWDGFFLSYDVS